MQTIHKTNKNDSVIKKESDVKDIILRQGQGHQINLIGDKQSKWMPPSYFSRLNFIISKIIICIEIL